MSTTSAPPASIVAPASDAERWVAAFSEGWRAPRGPERFAARFARSPRAWPRFLRVQASRAANHLRIRRSR
jgi:hypothetical protein